MRYYISGQTQKEKEKAISIAVEKEKIENNINKISDIIYNGVKNGLNWDQISSIINDL